MVHFRKALLLAPVLYSLRSKVTVFSTVALFILPTTLCAGDLPQSGKEGKDDDNFFKKLMGKLPNNVKDDFSGLIGNSAESIKAVIESGVPSQVGYGFMMGYSSGFCLKKVSKLLAFGLGGAFILVQAMSYNGYINVNYSGIQKDIERILDLNNDGVFDSKDVEVGVAKVRDVLEYNMPSGGGFTAGLLMGLRG